IGDNDNGDQLEAEGDTDANGNYCVVALVNTNAFPGSDFWRLFPNNDNPNLANYVISTSSGTNLSAGQAVRQDFRALPVTGRISGRVQNNLGVPLSNLGVGANAVINGTNYTTAQVHTDGSGNYSVGAANGDWWVNVNCCGDDGLDGQGYYDPLEPHMVTL